MLLSVKEIKQSEQNLKLGMMTGFSAGMVNVASVIVFFSFTSNITGHFAILAEELSKGNWYQASVVFAWIVTFFAGNFTSSLLTTHLNNGTNYLSNVISLSIEMMCLVAVGIYGHFFYTETLSETEILAGILLFAMGVQNGLTASISNFTVKTTHMTGLTTDLGILFAMFTKKENRESDKLRRKARLLLTIGGAYLSGGILAGVLYINLEFLVFVFAGFIILGVILYDFVKLKVLKLLRNYGRMSVYGG